MAEEDMGMVRLKAPRGHVCVGFAGREYAVGDGVVDVPDDAEEPLRAHGYRRWTVEPPRAAAPQAKKV